MDFVIGAMAHGLQYVNGTGGLDGSTIFRIASLSKVLTTTALARLVGGGALSLDDPVGKHLPGLELPGWADSPMLIRHLATHTSGLRDPHYPGDDGTLTGFTAGLTGMRPASPPGTVYSYSNFGMSLLGNMLAAVTGTTFAKLIDDVVCGPLGMDDTVLELNPQQAQRLAVGHEKGKQVATPTLPLHAPSGGYHSTVDDLMKLLRAQLAEPDALSHRTWFSRESGTGVGLGWHIGSLAGSGERMLWHNGNLRGYRSYLAFVPTASSGIVALANSGSGVEEIALRTLADIARATD